MAFQEENSTLLSSLVPGDRLTRREGGIEWNPRSGDKVIGSYLVHGYGCSSTIFFTSCPNARCTSTELGSVSGFLQVSQLPARFLTLSMHIPETRDLQVLSIDTDALEGHRKR